MGTNQFTRPCFSLAAMATHNNVHLSSVRRDWMNGGLRTDSAWPLSVSTRAINEGVKLGHSHYKENEIADTQLSDFQCQRDKGRIPSPDRS
mmetsp:Transcript_23911/g.58438  ORF Transcript_23911/g.58438 Transcript_23911/m.58438 type:complete len:91 (+) Transcript_23911:1150-1422(+)